MQEFEYRLEKEDYKNWIHWNVLKHESKKMKMVSALLYVAFLALFLGKNVTQFPFEGDRRDEDALPV